jgi:hypothetical protein
MRFGGIFFEVITIRRRRNLECKLLFLRKLIKFQAYFFMMLLRSSQASVSIAFGT